MNYKNSNEAELALIQFEGELREANRCMGLIEQEQNGIRRHILEMEIKKDDLREPMRKAKENIKRIESEMRVAKTEFWRLKNEGL
jgi:DNA repair exonuclease SbcCD ATPase subunit